MWKYAPELFVYIKMYVDEHRNNGDFWLTGSQAFHMLENISESLAGRVGIVRMSGLSNAEVQQTFHDEFVVDMERLVRRGEESKAMDAVAIFERIYRGSMPRLYENPEVDLEQYYESYIDTYITRDIKELTKVADEMQFLNFVRAAAARTASNVNFTELADILSGYNISKQAVGEEKFYYAGDLRQWRKSRLPCQWTAQTIFFGVNGAACLLYSANMGIQS